MPLLEGRGVTKYFGGLAAIEDVNFHVDEGEIVGLIGPNGSGKTTLFNVIAGTYLPTRGSITFAGREIAGLKSHQVCHLGIGRTFQIVKPFLNMTTLLNTMVGMVFGQEGGTMSLEEARREAEMVLRLTGLEDKRDALAKTLSLGQLKRLELARALATRPKLLLLDEVMAGLTPAAAAEMVVLIRKVRDTGVTIFFIEHSLKLVAGLAERVMVLDQGRKIAEGRPEEVVGQSRVMEAYWGEEQFVHPA